MITGLESALLIAGGIVVIASFIFSSKSDGNEKNEKDVVFTDKEKQEIKKQIDDIFEEQADDIKDRTEIALDKLSNEKMLEMNGYSDTILSEINRNHNEVMFLYDMLNEKKKEINNTVRDINAARKDLEEKIRLSRIDCSTDEGQDEGPDCDRGEHTLDGGTFNPAKTDITADKSRKQSEKPVKKTGTGAKTRAAATKNPAKYPESKEEWDLPDRQDISENSLKDDNTGSQEIKDGLVQTVTDDTEAPAKKTRKRTSTSKTAVKRLKETVSKESTRTSIYNSGNYETGNNNQKILELASKGRSNVEIAKELGLGIGEVKLVIDLFKGGK